MDDPGQATSPTRVLIAGAGVAGLEAAFALHELAGDHVTVTVLAPAGEFAYRPMSVGEPFDAGTASRYPVADLLAQAGAHHVRDALAAVDTARRTVRTEAGSELSYDALIVCPGAGLVAPYEHVVSFDDGRADELLHGLVQDLEGGYVGRLAIVVPAPMAWPLPAYELALMAAARAAESAPPDAVAGAATVTLLTPESAPLQAFGTRASEQAAALLAQQGIEFIGSAYCEVPRARTVVVHPGGRTIEADRIVALPALHGPGIEGLPQDGDGFLPIDDHGRVRGVDGVWAAGDATDHPVKFGGVAAQLADLIAASIAAGSGAAGTDLAVPPFAPELEGVLLTGGRPLRIHGRTPGSPDDDSGLTELPRTEDLPAKIAARYLAPHL
jgi:sulfide:quinone oxidoreductase